MDPVSGALLLKAGGALAGGALAYSSAKGQQEQAKVNAYIGRTRALQTDTVERQNLESDLGTLRTSLAANEMRPGVGTLEVVNALRKVKDRERRINVGNRMAEAADWRMRAGNAGSAATGGLFSGFINAGPSLFDLYQYRSG